MIEQIKWTAVHRGRAGRVAGYRVAAALAVAALLAVGTWVAGQAPKAATEQVARAALPDITLPTPVPAVRPVSISDQLQQPVRSAGPQALRSDIPTLVTAALDDLEIHRPVEDPLPRLVIRLLAEGQSDLYLDAALNAALSRGSINGGHLVQNGRFDTDRLLSAVAARVAG